ncbi:MAG TPA: cysteine dioxygenase family protein [Acidimicrobiales bacterium]|nr:cysteine dioxygenase family protein [Acidimicrobiales bacterium]
MALAHTLSTPSEALVDRAAELNDLVESLHLGDRRLTPTELEKLATVVAGRRDLWGDLVVDSPARRWWLVLFRTDQFDVRVLSWETDQASDWHDHGGSSGGFLVVDGTLDERYRIGDGSRLLQRRFEPGSSGCFGPSHVHDMVHDSGHPAVSVHAYSPPLTCLTMYDETPYGLVAREICWEDDRG